MEEIGQQLGVSRVRIHQILNLLKLDQRIIDYIQNINNPRQNNYWTERRLRNIAALPKKNNCVNFKPFFKIVIYNDEKRTISEANFLS